MLYRLFWCRYRYFLFSIWKVVSACQNESGKKVNAPILLAICGFCAEKKRKKIRILRSFAAICILHLRLLYHTRKACTSHTITFWQDFDQCGIDQGNIFQNNQCQIFSQIWHVLVYSAPLILVFRVDFQPKKIFQVLSASAGQPRWWLYSSRHWIIKPKF